MYNLSTTVDPNKIFLIKRSELDGRIDAAYIAQKLKTKRKYNYPTEKLNKLVRSLTGGTPSKEKPEYWDGDIYWVSPKDFKQFYIDKSEDTITELGLSNSSTKLIPANSILIVVRSGVLIHTLPVAINTIPVTINQDIKALIPTNKILPEYLGYYFNVFNTTILPLIVKHSTTVQSVNTNEFDRLEIPVPPIKDQQLIVNILNSALSAKQQKEAEAKALLASIDAYLLGELGISLPEQNNSLEKRIFITKYSDVAGKRFDSYYYTNDFYQLEGQLSKSKYRYIPFSDVVQSISNGFDFRDYKDSGTPYIKVANVKPGEFDFTKIQYIDFNSSELVKKIQLKKGNLLLTRKGTFGNALALAEDYDYIISSEVFYIELKQDVVESGYLEIFLNSYIGQKQFDRIKIGAIMGSLSQEALKFMRILLPPLEKQTEIANHIQNIRSQAKALQQEAARVLEEAKREVEKMILGE